MEISSAGERPDIGQPVIESGSNFKTGLLALIPLVLLGLLVFAFASFGNELIGPSRVPADALGRLELERIDFRDDEIVVRVLNSGPADLAIAQVIVNEAIWAFTVQPDGPVARLGRATVSIPYPWLEGEPHAVKLVAGNGLAFSGEVAIATPSPEPSLAGFGVFALLGIYVGVLPVFLGLIWLPMLRRLGNQAIEFLLALTIGLLVFLGFDALGEAFGLAASVPGPFNGIGLVGIGALGAFLVLITIGQRTRVRRSGASEREQRLRLAYLIALGIGLHNLGEGLAIGSAYAIGELALGALLVIGFMIHNTTEGLGILSPVAREPISFRHLLFLGLLGGAPTIAGTWLGGFVFANLWATLFLALGAGAIFQVVYELARRPKIDHGHWLTTPANFVGLLTGMLIMYLTGLLVAA